jgi:hypothetical protein
MKMPRSYTSLGLMMVIWALVFVLTGQLLCRYLPCNSRFCEYVSATQYHCAYLPLEKTKVFP